MDKGDIIRARWIKPAARRTPHQTCGHAIFTLQTPQAANEVLVNGLFVQQKKIYAEKCKREPLRCLRCHGWGHIVRDCSASVDTCGTCAQRHRTDTCTNTARPHCVSCGRAGHASWARSCPVFQRKCGEIDERLEDNKLPYFPMDEEWTHVRVPPKVIYVVVPSPPMVCIPPRNRAAPMQYQSTLHWAGVGQSAALRGPPMPSQEGRQHGQNLMGRQDSSPTSPTINE